MHKSNPMSIFCVSICNPTYVIRVKLKNNKSEQFEERQTHTHTLFFYIEIMNNKIMEIMSRH